MPSSLNCCPNEPLPSTIAVGLGEPARAGCEWIGRTLYLKYQNDGRTFKGRDSDSSDPSRYFEASVVCTEGGHADVKWEFNADGCSLADEGGGCCICGENYTIGFLAGTSDVSLEDCCGYPEGTNEWEFTPVDVILDSPPVATGRPPRWRPPCTGLPPGEEDCCRESGGEGGGGGGGPCGFAGVCGHTPPIFSSQPVRYATGEAIIQATDIDSSGFGSNWGHTRSFASRPSVNETLGNGYNWQVAEWPYLVFDFDRNVVVQGKPNTALWFNKAGDNYVAEMNVKQTLIHDQASGIYKLYDLDGAITEFDATTGRFRRHTDPGGNTIEVKTLCPNQYNPATVERTYASGGGTITEQLYYQYETSTGDQLLQRVTLRRQVDAGPWTNVSRANYTYYGVADDHGVEGDLATVTTQEWDGSAWTDTGTTLYRYYKNAAASSSSSSSSFSSSSSSSGTASGFTRFHLLKYVVNPDAYQRLAADPDVADPLSVADAVVALYADNYFEYDDNRRVTKETVQGGSTTYTFQYQQSGNPDGHNSWKTKTTETQPGGVEFVVYANHEGQTMLKVHRSGTDVWCEFYRYDDSGQIALHANPEAISGYDDGYADLLNQTAGSFQYLKSDTGLVDTYQYHEPTGRPTLENVQEGEEGTPVKLREWEYTPDLPSSSSSSSSSSSASTASTPVVYLPSKEIVYPSESDQTLEIVTTYHHTFHPGTNQVLQETVTLPAVSTDQNGPGTAAARKQCFDTYGNLTWSMDERGFLTRNTYDIVTGGLTQRIDDVDVALVSDAPDGWTTPAAGGQHLVTDLQHDDLGRVTQVLGPLHSVDLDGTAANVRTATWTVYKEDSTGSQVRTARGYAVPATAGSSSSSSSSGGPPQYQYTYTLVNPVSITKRNHAGNPIEEIQATRASTAGRLIAADTFAQSTYVRWTTHQYTECCSLVSSRVYHAIPPSGEGSSGTHYDQTDFAYNDRGMKNRTVTPGGTITTTVFDARDLAEKIYVGTDDSGAIDSDPTGCSVGPAPPASSSSSSSCNPANNMLLVTENQFDGGSDGGDGLLTQQTQHVDGSTTRVTTHTYDYRGRRLTTDGEVDFFEKRYYDNLSRPTQVERYHTTAAGNLTARSETFYDDRGRAYQTKRYAVDPATGTVGSALVSNTWYDASGRKIKEQSAGSKAFTKTVYDGTGRKVKQYQGFDTDETSYTDASTVSGDTIVEQAEQTHDQAGNVIQTTSRQRFHNATGTGELTSPSGSQPKARVTHAAAWPDALGRARATADYGTYAGATFGRPNIIPNRTDTILVTSTEFDSAGNPFKTIDPAGREDRKQFDAAGRVTKIIQNYTDGDPSTGGPDEDVTIETTYNADGNILTLTAKNSTTGDQVTKYVYGTDVGAITPAIYSNDLLRAEIYPDSDDTTTLGDGADGVYDRVEYKYNRQGERIWKKDQNGTIHEFTFDALGRLLADKVTTVGSGVDNAVLRIAKTYEVRGMVERLTSYDAATAGTAVNQAVFEYDDSELLFKEYQEHEGAKDANTLYVQYNRDTSATSGQYTKGLRPTSIRYPNGRLVHNTYGTAGGIGDAINRLEAIKDDNAGSPGNSLAEYSYLGSGTIVIEDFPQPAVKLNYDSGTAGDYACFDRFGRVVDQLWYDYGAGATRDQYTYGYDRAGNRLYRENTIASGKVEFYSYDQINRLANFDRGDLNVGKTAITGTPVREEDFTLDMTGNWTGFVQKTSGTTDLDQDRTHNKVNEIIDITETAGTAWVTPVEDKHGNMTTVPKPSSLSNGLTLTYDPWNRLVEVKDGTTAVARYEYDGLNRRIKKHFDSQSPDNPDGIDTYIHYFYNSSWQILETRQTTTESSQPENLQPKYQNVWSPRYIDAPILRDENTDQDFLCDDQRLYYLTDANHNVTTLTNTTGDAIEHYQYDPYGKVTIYDATWSSIRSTSSYNNVIRYTGRELDSESGIMHYRSRYYSTELCRFLSRDPVVYEEGYSLYEYALSNPVRYADASGEVAWFVGIGGGVGFWHGLCFEIAKKAAEDSFKNDKKKHCMASCVANRCLALIGPGSVLAGGVFWEILGGWVTVDDDSILDIGADSCGILYSYKIWKSCKASCDKLPVK